MVKSGGISNIITSMNAQPELPPTGENFILKSNPDFAGRCIDVFNKLSTLESNHESWVSENNTIDSFEDENVNKPTFKEANCFKRPLPPKSSRLKPKYYSPRRNSRKWKKYSLADIPLSSDAANSAIAFRFLDELRKRKEEKGEQDTTDEKIVFKKPSISRIKVNSFASNAEIQPEISSDSKIIRSHKYGSQNEIPPKFDSKIKLQHLMDD